jgi:hypothetical protein
MDSSFAFPSKAALASDGTPSSGSKRYGTTEGSLPNAIDFSHHLNELSKHRATSSLKEMYKYASLPGMISMAGGMSFPCLTVRAPSVIVYPTASPPFVHEGFTKKSSVMLPLLRSPCPSAIPVWRLLTPARYPPPRAIPIRDPVRFHSLRRCLPP